MTLTWIDNGIIALVVVSMIISLIRGFVKEALSLVVWLLAFIIGARFSAPLSQLFVGHIANPSVRLAVSFLILFVVTLILGGLVNFLISELVVKTGLSGTNRLLGFIFGFLRGIVVVALLILFAQLTAIPNSKAWKESMLIPKIEPVALWLKVFVPQDLGQYLSVEKITNTVTKHYKK
jgi:membrane protein required for colicin V production